MTEIKRTIWVRRAGFEVSPTPDRPKGTPRYLVIKTQNTIAPRVFENVSEVELDVLIERGFVVNIKGPASE